MGQDLDGAREVDIGNLAALDVGVGGGVKRALRGVRHGLCDPRVATKVAKSVSEPGGQVKLASPAPRPALPGALAVFTSLARLGSFVRNFRGAGCSGEVLPVP